MTISNSHVLNCRVNAPGLWPLTISLGAPLSAFSSCSKADSDFGDTLVRKPSERDAAEQKPTPIKPGVWRNKWFVKNPVRFVNLGGRVINEGEFISPREWPSREIAEQKALDYVARSLKINSGDNGFARHAEYLGPVFFPEEAAS